MKCVVIPGDGIGPEVAKATQRILDAAGAGFEWVEAHAGAEALQRFGEALPRETVDLVAEVGIALKGPTTTPVGGGARSANVELRRTLDLYANLRPVRTLAGVPSRYQDVDLVIVRENTEDLYSGLEHVVVPGVVESIKIITDRASTRIARWAYDYARRHGRRSVHIVHKANIMKLSDGLFLECCRRVGRDYADIETRDVIVDALCMKLVCNPNAFDVLVLENLYGDIVSDLCAGLVGGLGVVGGANIGDKCAVFEAVHGSAPDIAGKGVANPTAMLQSALLMLQHLGLVNVHQRIDTALRALYSEGTNLTPDVGGKASTDEMTSAIIAKL